MNSAAMATSLLGRSVRLREPPLGEAAEGKIVLVYIDQAGLHYVVEVEGRLVTVEAAQLRLEPA